MPLFGNTSITKLIEKKDVLGLIKALENNLEVEDRKQAVIALGDIGESAAFDVLVKMLNDEDKHVRSSVAEALGKLGDLRGVQPLMNRLKEPDEYPLNFHTALIQIIDQSADENAKIEIGNDMLIALESNAPRMQTAAIVVIAHIIEELTKHDAAYMTKFEEKLIGLLDSNNGSLQGKAFEALISCFENEGYAHKYELAVQKITESQILRHTPIRKSGLRLMILASEHIKEIALLNSMRLGFRAYSNDHYADHRELVYRALGQIGEDQDLRTLVRRLTHDVDRACQMEAGKALLKLNRNLAQEILLEEIDKFSIADENASVLKSNWYGAVGILGSLDNEWVEIPLKAIIRNQNFKGSVADKAKQILEKAKK